jgi:fatty acid-binding protein DegV
MKRKFLLLPILLLCLNAHALILSVNGYGNVPEEGEAMRAILERDLLHKTVLFVHQITATLAINTGPGLVGVMVFREP